MNKTVSILGCGWLGKALAHQLTDSGFTVKASRTSVFIDEKLIPFTIKVSPAGIQGENITEFFRADTLIISLTPGRTEEKNNEFILSVRQLIPFVKNIRQVIFISSTSVYPDINGEVSEEEIFLAEKGSGKTLTDSEQILMQANENTVVLRFGGLIGHDRLPGKFLSGKTNLKNGNAPVNLIHRDDACGVIKTIIEKNITGEIFNSCMNDHPLRKDFYTRAAQLSGLPVPEFDDNEVHKFKIVNSGKLQKIMGYRFIYNSPLDCLPGR
ncbi:MAG: SDR family NAD(P)-dependent oxidoreductase [Bacteroidota bacterium]